MNGTEVRSLWADIAAGALEDHEYGPFDLHQWVKGVAAEIVEADNEPIATKRVYRMTKAAGLEGGEDPHGELKAAIAQYSHVFDFPDEDGAVRPLTRAQRVNRLFDFLNGTGLLRGSYGEDPRRSKDLIRSLLPKDL